MLSLWNTFITSVSTRANTKIISKMSVMILMILLFISFHLIGAFCKSEIPDLDFFIIDSFCKPTGFYTLPLVISNCHVGISKNIIEVFFCIVTIIIEVDSRSIFYDFFNIYFILQTTR